MDKNYLKQDYYEKQNKKKFDKYKLPKIINKKKDIQIYCNDCRIFFIIKNFKEIILDNSINIENIICLDCSNNYRKELFLQEIKPKTINYGKDIKIWCRSCQKFYIIKNYNNKNLGNNIEDILCDNCIERFEKFEKTEQWDYKESDFIDKELYEKSIKKQSLLIANNEIDETFEEWYEKYENGETNTITKEDYIKEKALKKVEE